MQNTSMYENLWFGMDERCDPLQPVSIAHSTAPVMKDVFAFTNKYRKYDLSNFISGSGCSKPSFCSKFMEFINARRSLQLNRATTVQQLFQSRKSWNFDRVWRKEFKNLWMERGHSSTTRTGSNISIQKCLVSVILPSWPPAHRHSMHALI